MKNLVSTKARASVELVRASCPRIFFNMSIIFLTMANKKHQGSYLGHIFSLLLFRNAGLKKAQLGL